jgi:predicted metal-dependent enzyme (double-stranded beta helix superfamily)
VGIYAGRREEEFYRRTGDGDPHVGHAELEHIRTEENGVGDLYELVPPDNGIHGVRPVSEVPSVSVHLLGADVGCIQRHQFDPDDGFVEPFRSRYTNVRCETALSPPGNHGHSRSQPGAHGHHH